MSLSGSIFSSASRTFPAGSQRVGGASSEAGARTGFGNLAAYLGSYAVVSSNSSSFLANVLTVFPLTAPLVLPARSALVGVPLWEHALALVLVVASIYALVRLAGRLYGHGLLHSGPSLGARAAWRLTRQP
jgi:ABC-type Na+ efflux pump permease subunit